MSSLKQFSLILAAAAVAIFIGLAGFVLAQTTTTATTSTTTATTSTSTTAQNATSTAINQMINQDENVQPQDLGVSKVGMLPNSPFYFFKNWWRGLTLAFTFNPVKKLELQEKFANQKLLELQKLAQKTKNPKILDKAINSYQKEIDKVKNRAEKLKLNPKIRPKIESFLDKFIRHQVLQQRVLGKLENTVPKQAFEKIKKAREEHLKRFRDVMLKLENKKKIPERLEKALEKVKGSKFKAIKNLEFLKRLETIVPEDQKQEIQQAEDKIMERFKDKLEKMPPQVQKRFSGYLEKVPGNKEQQLQILQGIQERLQNRPELQKRLMEGKKEIIKKVMNLRRERVKKCLEQYLPQLPDKIKTCVQEKLKSGNAPKPEELARCIKDVSPQDMAKAQEIGKKLSECLRMKPIPFIKPLPLNQQEREKLRQILKQRIKNRVNQEKLKEQQGKENNQTSTEEKELEKMKNLIPTKIPTNLPKIPPKARIPLPRY